ncbi:hypothetical protein [Undibacterium danionis]|uniref:Uncharacterized protein n=1 Tax=Undibacterium danionis TaxID=1812100 RepID=A0ABV6IEP2_9BURK
MNNIESRKNDILTFEEIKLLLGQDESFKSKVSFAVEDVPEGLRVLIPYAEVWGLSDDWTRENFLTCTPALLKQNLKNIVVRFDNQLDDWLAGEEALSSEPTDAYIAFSAMRMSADFI